MPTEMCADCGLLFLCYNKRSLRCKPCQHTYRLAQQLEHQRKRHDAKRRNESSAEMSEEEVDRVFNAALKEIRRQSSESLEPFRSYGWLYREPRS